MNLLVRSLVCIGLSLPVISQAEDIQLKAMIRTVYPSQVMGSKVELLDYILKGSGYKIYSGNHAPQDANSILIEKPTVQKKVLMSRLDAMLMAIGEANALVVDHNHKMISVTRDPLYDE